MDFLLHSKTIASQALHSANRDADKERLASLSKGTLDVWDRNFGDRRLSATVNALLRTYIDPSKVVPVNFLDIHFPTDIPGIPTIASHQDQDADPSIEIQHVAGVLMAQQQMTDEQLCKVSLGEWLRLCSFLGHPSNTFIIPKSYAHYKSHLSPDLYQLKLGNIEGDPSQEVKLSFIRGLLGAKIDAEGRTVKDNLLEMCESMKVAKGPYADLTCKSGTSLSTWLTRLTK